MTTLLDNMINQVNNIYMERDSILDLIYVAHKYLARLESSPRDYGTGDLLYSTDIHTVTAVSEFPGINLTQLALHLDVSKAAASKFVRKLVDKGYLLKGQSKYNNKEVLFNLTAKGRKAAKLHREFELETFRPLMKLEQSLADDERNTIVSFLNRLTNAII